MDIDDAPQRLRVLPSWLLNQAALPAQNLVSQALGGADARRADFSVLSVLEEFGPCSQVEIGRRCGIDRSDVVALLNALSEQSLVARAPDPTDRRRNVITLTAPGRRRLRRLDRIVADAQDELLAGLTTKERSELVRLLTQIVTDHR